jgi:membrane associated rhomboid family serine protease
MILNILTIIILITVIVSYRAFQNKDLLYKLMFIPFNIKENNEKYRFISHIFIHADLTHLIFNMISLYFLGDVLLNMKGGDYISNNGEITNYRDGWLQLYGFWLSQLMFLILYFGGALFSSIFSYYKHKDNYSYRALGASGAVSAVIFAAILWNPTMKIYFFFIPIGIPAYIFGPLYIIYEIYMNKNGNTNIAHDAHISGAIFGILFILLTNFETGKRFIELIFT